MTANGGQTRLSVKCSYKAKEIAQFDALLSKLKLLEEALLSSPYQNVNRYSPPLQIFLTKKRSHPSDVITDNSCLFEEELFKEVDIR